MYTLTVCALVTEMATSHSILQSHDKHEMLGHEIKTLTSVMAEPCVFSYSEQLLQFPTLLSEI